MAVLERPVQIKVISDANEMREWSRAQRVAGKTIGFVPTMGALHEGHMSLVHASVAKNDATVASIFVNPAQFAPNEDFDSYPRTFEGDARMCEDAGIDVIYAPDKSKMYPEGYSTYVEVHELQDNLCGKSRPIFFRGIATVVTKLFNVVEPDRAYFGQKDAQQAAIIKRMVEDLDFAITVEVMPIVREASGLAMSSRNRYLTEEEKTRGLGLSRGLREAERLIAEGERDPEVIKNVVRDAMDEFDRFDYVEVVDADTIQPIERIAGRVLIAGAGYMGEARLIDNIICEVSER